METDVLDYLKQAYSYDAWRDLNTLDETLFIQGCFLCGDEFPSWQHHRIQRVDTPESPPCIQSIWQRSEGRSQALLRVDIFECASRLAAHEYLVQLLGEFQSPIMARQEDMAVGDVMFTAPGDTIVAFSRANLLLLICNAGRDQVPVTALARQFDRDLISKPIAVRGLVAPEIQQFQTRSAEPQVGISVPLEIEASDPSEQPLMYKFFSRSGEVFLEEGNLIYQQTATGRPDVTVYAINHNRGVTSRAL